MKESDLLNCQMIIWTERPSWDTNFTKMEWIPDRSTAFVTSQELEALKVICKTLQIQCLEAREN